MRKSFRKYFHAYEDALGVTGGSKHARKKNWKIVEFLLTSWMYMMIINISFIHSYAIYAKYSFPQMLSLFTASLTTASSCQWLRRWWQMIMMMWIYMYILYIRESQKNLEMFRGGRWWNRENVELRKREMDNEEGILYCWSFIKFL